jgi:DNA-binding CsgD family transcriptional regulator
LLLDDAAGFDDLRALADAHRAAGRVSEAVSCLSNLGSGSGEMMRLDIAERALRETILLAQSQEMDGQNDYASAWLALCRLHQGDWREAGTLAEAVCRRRGVTNMSRLMAQVALGRLRVRRGDPGAEAALDDALTMVGQPGTLQRLAPVRAARAEAAFARGDLAAVQREVEAALPLAEAKRHPWFVGELGYWGCRAGLMSRQPDGAAGPWALQMAGRWREAAAAWGALGCPYEQARAMADGDADAQRAALTQAQNLGAGPLAELLRRDMQRQGVRGVPRGPRAATQAHPAGLTLAEQRVLALIAKGLGNADIAQRLHRSVRTVEHQVAAVLAKLGATSRAEAAQRARREGWLGTPPAPPGHAT